MATITNEQLKGLLMQVKYAPAKQRMIQLDACETLIRLIKPGKSYPFEFICFHLTGYQSRKAIANSMLSYEELISALPAFSSLLSKDMGIRPSDIVGQVLSAKEVANRYGISEKTIKRWQKRGLVGRYLRYEDGKIRLAFRKETVSDFVWRNRPQVTQAKRFTRLGNTERELIVTRLAKWASRCPQYRQEAIKRTAKRFSRSVETVRRILTDCEQKRKPCIDREIDDGYGRESMRFSKASARLNDAQCHKIVKLHSQGVVAEELVKQFGCSKSSIYRILTDAKAKTLLAKKIEYIDSEEFSNKDAWKIYSGWPRELANAGIAISSEETSICGTLGAYARDIATITVLKAEQERLLFGKYNYHKYLAKQLQSRIDPKYPRAKTMERMETQLLSAEQVKKVLIQCNLRLVVSVARKHTRDEQEMTELISDGNMTLMRAVEKFDFGRGFKFSTYATWAIVRRFATRQHLINKKVATVSTDDLGEVASDMRVLDNRVLVLEATRRKLENVMERILVERERVIVGHHYGLTDEVVDDGKRKSRSFSQIGKLLGLSKERIRQIEHGALDKLRAVLTMEQFEVLTQG